MGSGLDGDLDMRAWLQTDLFAVTIFQFIFHANLLIEIIGRLDDNLRFLGFVGNHGRNDLFDGARQGYGGGLLILRFTHEVLLNALSSTIFDSRNSGNNSPWRLCNWRCRLQANDSGSAGYETRVNA
jgi:hypothetical protein